MLSEEFQKGKKTGQNLFFKNQFRLQMGSFLTLFGSVRGDAPNFYLFTGFMLFLGDLSFWQAFPNEDFQVSQTTFFVCLFPVRPMITSV